MKRDVYRGKNGKFISKKSVLQGPPMPPNGHPFWKEHERKMWEANRAKFAAIVCAHNPILSSLAIRSRW